VERLPVVLALTPLAERAVEHLVFGRDAVLEARGSAADADELEREVALREATCVLLSADLSGLTAAHCARVRARGVRVAGLIADSRQREELLALGVDAVVEPTDSEEVFLAALRGPGEETGFEPSERAVPRDVEDERSGGVLAVIGSKGAPGASECAASLSALAAERWSCVLVELDALGGGLDLRLGADPGQGSVLGLSRAVEAGDGGLGELLERWLTAREGWPPVLVGPPDPAQALGELALAGVAAATLRALASLYPLVVADVGSLLFAGADAGPVCRLHREAVVAADSVLLVLGAREEQVRAGLDQLDTLLALGIAPERLRVVVNGVGGPAATARIQLERVVLSQLAERRFAPDAWLPWDGRALARAQRTGLPLAGARRRGGYARALARTLDELFLPVAPTPRERKLRLVPPRVDAHEPEKVALP
jgi:MinD-like ATPase involved in chromosome partitioning or flagellar assembly